MFLLMKINLYDNKNVSGLGSYHYHCGGHPAHLHDGGVCPYSSSAAMSDTSTTSEVSTTTSGGAGWGIFGGGLASSNTSQTTTATPSASNAIQLNAGSSITISKDITHTDAKLGTCKRYEAIK